jgi:hypothetical protein
MPLSRRARSIGLSAGLVREIAASSRHHPAQSDYRLRRRESTACSIHAKTDRISCFHGMPERIDKSGGLRTSKWRSREPASPLGTALVLWHDSRGTCRSVHQCDAACARVRLDRRGNAPPPGRFDDALDVRPLVRTLWSTAAGVAASGACGCRRRAGSVGALCHDRYVHDQRAHHNFCGQLNITFPTNSPGAAAAPPSDPAAARASRLQPARWM